MDGEWRPAAQSRGLRGRRPHGDPLHQHAASRRHPLAPGEERTLRVAWVRFPDLEVQAVEQEYKRLDAGTGPKRYRYRNLTSGFVGELSADDEQMVVAYGPWVRR